MRHIPLYRQKRNYTCGPSSLMMVMSALDDRYQPNARTELELWREATTIHGGCGPVGLALALKRRGFAAIVVVSHDGVFLEARASRRDEIEAIRILQERDLVEAKERDVHVYVGDYSIHDLSKWMAEGWYPIVMISIEFEGRNVTHWVVTTGVDTNYVFFNDPLKEQAQGDEATRVGHAAFANLNEFGPKREKAVVLAGLPQMGDIELSLPKLNFGNEPTG